MSAELPYIIRGTCFTNLDEYRRENWPTAFIAVPRAGESVESTSGRSLRVVHVTHLESRRDEPRIKIELHC